MKMEEDMIPSLVNIQVKTIWDNDLNILVHNKELRLRQNPCNIIFKVGASWAAHYGTFTCIFYWGCCLDLRILIFFCRRFPGHFLLLQKSLDSGLQPKDRLISLLRSHAKSSNTCIVPVIRRHIMKHLENNKILTNLNYGLRSILINANFNW